MLGVAGVVELSRVYESPNRMFRVSLVAVAGHNRGKVATVLEDVPRYPGPNVARAQAHVEIFAGTDGGMREAQHHADAIGRAIKTIHGAEPVNGDRWRAGAVLDGGADA